LVDGLHTAFEGVLTSPRGGELTVQLTLLDELPRGHRSYARLLDASGSPETQRLLTRGSSPLRMQIAPAPPGDFFRLGIEHILASSDHLVFLAVVLLGAASMCRMAALVSAFALAHSLTLALATIGLISVSSRWVEASIAASIVWVAARNLVERAPQRERLAATLGFGLIHGLGFASALRALNADGSALALMQFNLGVEVGQLAAASLLVPCCMWLHRSLVAVRAVSGAAAALGCGWLLQRVLSP
jgi:hydrogenase/urease accessory protein HupE